MGQPLTLRRSQLRCEPGQPPAALLAADGQGIMPTLIKCCELKSRGGQELAMLFPLLPGRCGRRHVQKTESWHSIPPGSVVDDRIHAHFCAADDNDVRVTAPPVATAVSTVSTDCPLYPSTANMPYDCIGWCENGREGRKRLGICDSPHGT